jgi:uncharacterized protein (TIGR03067 family)
MRRTNLFLVAVLAITCRVYAEDVRDQDAIQGEWKLAEIRVFDPTFDKSENQSRFSLVINRDQMKYEYESGRKSEASKFELKPMANPKQINFSTGDDERQDRVGIYSIADDELKICFDTVSPVVESRRPTDFTTPAGSGKILMRFKRVKK